MKPQSGVEVEEAGDSGGSGSDVETGGSSTSESEFSQIRSRDEEEQEPLPPTKEAEQEAHELELEVQEFEDAQLGQLDTPSPSSNLMPSTSAAGSGASSSSSSMHPAQVAALRVGGAGPGQNEGLQVEVPGHGAAAPGRNQALPQKDVKTFFCQKIGLDDVGLAVSNRSKCYHCSQKIPKDNIRFSWYFSTLRPSNWVHSACLLPLVTAKRDLKDQVIARLRVLLQKAEQPTVPRSPAEANIAFTLRAVLAQINALND